MFSEEDVISILNTTIPQNGVKDRIAWTKATNGHYSVKTGLISKGVQLPVTCPMCDSDVENVIHLFFECPFARQCWSYVGVSYDTQLVDTEPNWILNKICEGFGDEVWENRSVNHVTAMDMSAKMFTDWKLAVGTRKAMQVNVVSLVVASNTRWSPPEIGCLNLNIDASIWTDSTSFLVGLVLRDHLGTFVARKVASLSGSYTVLGAETLAMCEGLKWVMSMPYQKVSIEFDSLLSVQAIQSPCENVLEVGHILENCRTYLRSRLGFSIFSVKWQANKAAHEMTKILCLFNCQRVFTTPPSSMQNMFLYDLPDY
ncbi:uncharacterized protein LOC141719750 [Apium graveolens]|uniref:uncharacterized protein LOC141719750 n=1 Tax=Apium graveolens TaxID=4045 RepID=UPI003D78FF2B